MQNVFLKSLLAILFLGFHLSIAANTCTDETKQFVVVLDAGHGGHDSGNRGGGYYEKNIALDIVLQTGKILENLPHVKVIYTRSTDVFIPLNERADIANNAKADLFVSVHCNAHHSKAFGTETFVLGLHANERNFDIAKKENSVILLENDYETNYDGFDPNSPESIIGITLMQEEYLEQSLDLASKIQDNFTSQLKRFNRGVKQAGFLVLHRTFMPSVLVETGFLTNGKEGKYLNSLKGKQSMAKAIAKAIVGYKNDISSIYDIENIIEEQKMIEEEAPKTEKNKSVETTTKIKENTTEVAKNKPSTKKEQEVLIKENSEEIVFKVQLLSGSSKIETSPSNFMGLQEVSIFEKNKVFKYFYGSETSYENAKQKKSIAIEKGYPSCFVVAFKNGEQIPLSQAVK